MKSLRLFMLCLTISLLKASSAAQVAESRSVQDVYVLPPGSVFGNRTDSTFFAIPRYRVERLVRDAMLSDSVQVLWKQDAERRDKEWLEVYSGKTFWKSTALISSAIAVIELVILLLGR